MLGLPRIAGVHAASRLSWALVVGGALLACTTKTVVTAAPPSDAGPGEAPDDGGATAPACPASDEPSAAATVATADVDEASGIGVSVVNDGVYWVHNDSGDAARAFAISSDGKLVATLTFDTAAPRDIEDMAIEDVSPGKAYLYFGDIGDNDLVRSSIKILRVEEPRLGANKTLTASSEAMTVTYANGAHDAETLLFDPLSKELLIATKAPGGPSEIHRVGPFAAGKRVTTEKIAEVAVDLATGGDISRDGRFIAIRNYTNRAFVWTRGAEESLADALARPPCKVKVARETQGESFAFLPDAKGYVTISEGASPTLNVATLR